MIVPVFEKPGSPWFSVPRRVQGACMLWGP